MCTVSDPDSSSSSSTAAMAKVDCSELYYLITFPLAAAVAFTAVESGKAIYGGVNNYRCNSYESIDKTKHMPLRESSAINHTNTGQYSFA